MIVATRIQPTRYRVERKDRTLIFHPNLHSFHVLLGNYLKERKPLQFCSSHCTFCVALFRFFVLHKKCRTSVVYL